MSAATSRNLLTGVRVLDFTQVIAGPACTRLMAELGAEVIKVELAPTGDLSRVLPVVRQGRSGYFAQHNQGKQSLCVDVRNPRGRELIDGLIRRTDVLVENFSPGTIGRLGLPKAHVLALNPDIIMCSISAFGQEGPLRELPGFDYIAQAMSGATSMIRKPDEPPMITGFAVGDVGTAVLALAGINAALFDRERGGGGRYLDISLVDFYFHCHELNLEVATLDKPPIPAGSHHASVAPLGVFRAPDGDLMLVVLPGMWTRLCEAMATPELEQDPRFRDNDARVVHRDALIDIIEAWMATTGSRDAAFARLRKARVPAAPVLSVMEAMTHPHMIERESVYTVDDPVLGPFSVTGNPLRFDGQPRQRLSRAPFLGEHNAAILQNHLGLSAEAIAELREAGILRDEPLPAGA
jgi:crotonobetainyl-CoA:carnitine CoA-transferase CaiB-like acyl-CoA transferase